MRSGSLSQGERMEKNKEEEVQDAIREILRLSEMMMEGKLDERGRADAFSGSSAELIEVVNRMLDTLIAPLRLMASAIQQIAHGSIPDFIIDEYKGEFNDIKKNMNTFLATLYGMHYETQNLIRAVKEGKLGTRGNDWDFEGNWKGLISGVNDTLDAVMDPIQEANRVLGKLADFDLCARMGGKYKGDHAQIKKALNTSLCALHEAFHQVAKAVGKVSTAGTQIRDSSHEVAQGALDQANSIRETSFRLEQIAKMAKQTARNTEQAKGIMKEAQLLVEDGKESTTKMIRAMGDIRISAEGTLGVLQEINLISAQTDDLARNAAAEAAKVGAAARGFAVVAEEVRKLALRSREMAARMTEALERNVQAGELREETALSGDELAMIIKEIGQMGLQTNYLALNAAVEAAHVGEAGLGFEMVTEKVRTLANRSKESAVKTEAILKDSVGMAQNGEKLSQEVDQVLIKIVDAVRSVSELVDEIASASIEQAQGVEVASQMVAKIERVTQENVANAEKSSSATEDLAAETERLDASIRRFKLDSGPSMRSGFQFLPS